MRYDQIARVDIGVLTTQEEGRCVSFNSQSAHHLLSRHAGIHKLSLRNASLDWFAAIYLETFCVFS